MHVRLKIASGPHIPTLHTEFTYSSTVNPCTLAVIYSLKPAAHLHGRYRSLGNTLAVSNILCMHNIPWSILSGK